MRRPIAALASTGSCLLILNSLLAPLSALSESSSNSPPSKPTFNASIEDTNWKIAAACLSAQFGPQFIRNKDVKCAASQVVLSLSRMQRAACKSCDPYFHCEGFANALSRCKNNYDVEDTLKVILDCKGLANEDAESVAATRAPSLAIDCQTYLCASNCNYNPTDNTCFRSTCQQQTEPINLYGIQAYKAHLNSRTRPLNLAYPLDSPVRGKAPADINLNRNATRSVLLRGPLNIANAKLVSISRDA